MIEPRKPAVIDPANELIPIANPAIATAREQWNKRDVRFGEFEDRIGGWIPAPELPNVTLQPR